MEVPVPFERYDDEFKSLMLQIEKSLAPEETSSNSNLTQNLLQQCEDLIKQMALEARSVPNPNLKRSLLDKVRACKAQWSGLKDQANQKGLFENTNTGGSGSAGNGRSYRDRMQSNEDSLGQQNDTLDNARRIMEETEVVALEITEELGQNREKLMNAHGRIHEVTGMTGRARRLLTSMNRRAAQQKMCLYGVAVAAVLMFVFAIWGMRG